MKLLITLFAFLAIFALAFGDDCTIDGHSFNKGETYAPKTGCILYSCDGEGQVSGKTCPYSPSACGSDDKTKQFPECCAKLEC